MANDLVLALSTVADAVMILLLFFGFALTYKDPFWAKQPNWKRLAILMIVGSAGAIVAELRHMGTNNWAYSDAMPVITFTDAGLSPVLQFMVLPAMIYLVFIGSI